MSGAVTNLLHTAHVPAGEGPFPTVLALHGWGASAHDLLGLAPLLHRGRALVLCPQGELEVPIAPGHVGYGWFPLRTTTALNPEAFRAAAEAVRRFLQAALARYPIDPARLAVKGVFLTRPTLWHYTATRDELLRRAGDVFSWVRSGLLKLRIHRTFALADAADAHRLLEGRGSVGKLLLIP